MATAKVTRTGPILYDATFYSDRPTWLAARRQALGASDTPAILGLLPYKSAIDVYADKVGNPIVHDDSDRATEAMQWGTILEPAIRDEYARRSGRKVVYRGPWRILRSRPYPWMAATLDGIVVDPDKGRGVLEVKTTSAWPPDDLVAPLAYRVQIQHAMLVAGVRWGVVAVLHGGQRLVTYDVARHDDFLEALVPHLEAFWTRVAKQAPPPVPATAADADVARMLAVLYPAEVAGTRVELPAEAAEWDRMLVKAKQQGARWAQMRQAYEVRLKEAIGDAEVGILPGGATYTWRVEPRDGYTVEPSQPRVLRRKEGGR